jgi:MerR family transcriptional regulator/heat shock protein HspR
VPERGRRERADRVSHVTKERERSGQDPSRPVYVISVAASLVSVHPRTLRIYEGEGLVCPARTRTNIRLYSENDLRRILWIRHLTQNLGVNLAGVRVLIQLAERLGMRILERLYREPRPAGATDGETTPSADGDTPSVEGRT